MLKIVKNVLLSWCIVLLFCGICFMITTAFALDIDTSPNSSYLSNLHSPDIKAPMDSTTMGLMMMLSTLQYQAPYLNNTYSNAVSQASKAAFITSGGQAMQDSIANNFTKNGLDFARSAGLTDTEMGIVGFTAKTVRSRQVNIKGPTFGPIKSSIQGTNNSGSIGLKWEFN
jgi:hypothetical protein